MYQIASNQPFCILNDGTPDTADVTPATKVCDKPGTPPYNYSKPYGIGVIYDSNSASATYQVYTVTVKWTGANGGSSQVTLYYKAT